MENNYGSTRLSLFMAIISALSFITKTNVAWVIGCISGCVAICSGLMAIRYYYYATRKVRKETNGYENDV